MQSDWKYTPLGDILILQRGHDLPSDKRQDGIIPIIGSAGITGYHSEAKMSGPGVVIGRSGNSMGNISFTDIDYWPLNTGLYIKDFKGNNCKYIYYLLQTINFDQFNSGSAQKSLNRNFVYPYKVYMTTSILEQKKIAHILSTLDDKIEINRKMNQTLEEMAQALFKSWFVDFDPVHAKANAKSDEALDSAAAELGIAKEVLEVFPNEVEESEMGMIPLGWEVGTLSNIIKQRNERVIPSEETKTLPYVPTDCIDSKSLSLSNVKRGEEAKSSLIKFYKDDILFGAMRPYFHKVCIAPVNGTTRTTVFVLNTHEKNDYAFGLLSLYQEATVSYATRHSTGTTIPYAKWSGVLEKMPIVIPAIEIRKSFNSIIEPLLKKISSTYKQQVSLQNTRDTLLPKLLSGELDVSCMEVE